MSNGALPLEALRVIQWDDILAHMDTRADVVDPVSSSCCGEMRV